jgi:hypothetical protein
MTSTAFVIGLVLVLAPALAATNQSHKAALTGFQLPTFRRWPLEASKSDFLNRMSRL